MRTQTLNLKPTRRAQIRCHRGLRHYWGLRVKGQHTKVRVSRSRVLCVRGQGTRLLLLALGAVPCANVFGDVLCNPFCLQTTGRGASHS